MELEKIIKLNEKYNLIEEDDKIIVGFSGGPDSVFLVEILKKIRETINFDFFLVHINHMLRGEDADEDEEFSKKYATQNNIRFFSKRINIEKIALEKKKTLEEVGREERYSLFEEILEEVDGNKIATAHNKDDQIETFLFKMMRGTSLQGLEGIKIKTEIKNMNLIRPISEVYKKDIINYLNKNEIQYRIDKTNFENEFTRNSIRLDLIPFIEKRYNLKFKDKIFSLIEEIRENNHENKVFLKNYMFEEKLILKKLILESWYKTDRVIAFYMQNNNIGVSRIKINKIRELLYKNGTKKLDLDAEYRIVKDYKYLYLEKKLSEKRTDIKELVLEIPSEIKFGDYKIFVKEYKEENYTNGRYTYVLEISQKSILKVRTRQKGDKIKLLGDGGTKKIKKIFIDEKIPKDKRNGVPVLLLDDEIFWLAGVKKGKIDLEKKSKKNLQKVLFFIEEDKVEG